MFWRFYVIFVESPRTLRIATARHIFNFLLGAWKCDQLVFHF